MVIVVGVLAVLASAAVPAYGRYVLRAKRAEAYIGLRHIHDLQESYYVKHREYSSSFAELGPPLRSGQLLDDGSFQGPIYTFTLTTWEFEGQANGNYRATAAANLDSSDGTLDVLIIENQVTVID